MGVICLGTAAAQAAWPLPVPVEAGGRRCEPGSSRQHGMACSPLLCQAMALAFPAALLPFPILPVAFFFFFFPFLMS